LRFDEAGYQYLNIIICVVFLLATPVFLYFATKDESSLAALKTGWIPIIAAMTISRFVYLFIIFIKFSCGGFFLQAGVTAFSTMAVYQPVVNGNKL
jgi:hypothetical protein